MLQRPPASWWSFLSRVLERYSVADRLHISFFSVEGRDCPVQWTLEDALRCRGYDVTPFAFKALYPDFLVKGGTEECSRRRCRSARRAQSGALIIPFPGPVPSGILRSLKPDLLLVAYWTGFLAPFYFVVRRLTGIRMVVLLHNLSSHESFLLDPLYAEAACRFRRWICNPFGRGYAGCEGCSCRQFPVLQLFHPLYEPERQMPSVDGCAQGAQS